MSASSDPSGEDGPADPFMDGEVAAVLSICDPAVKARSTVLGRALFVGSGSEYTGTTC
jgi:hypothetical protein